MEVAGTITLKHVYEIAKIKLADLNAEASKEGGLTVPGGSAPIPQIDEEQMCRVVAGSARSMGIRIVR